MSDCIVIDYFSIHTYKHIKRELVCGVCVCVHSGVMVCELVDCIRYVLCVCINIVLYCDGVYSLVCIL